MIVILLFFQLAWSQSMSFGTCGDNQNRTATDNFCPRLEGAYPAHCCPVVAKSAPIQCFYHTESSVMAKRPSTQTNCVADANVVTNCCQEYQLPCKKDLIQRSFVQRLIKRTGACCFENCPPADYWRDPPRPDAGFKPEHVLTGRSAPGASCTDPPPNTCNGLPACGASDYCPVAVVPGGPGGGGSGSGGGGGSGTGTGPISNPGTPSGPPAGTPSF